MFKIVVIGAGYIGEKHCNAIDTIPNAKLVGIIDRNLKSALKLGKKFNSIGCSNIDELKDKSDFDVAVICLPTFLHEDFIIKLANMGKHILCEKPITLTLESLYRIKGVIEKNGIKYMTAQVLRFWREYEIIKQLFDKGEFGEVKMIYGARLSQLPNWNKWFVDPDKSGGSLFDLHLHDIDFTIHMLGEVTSLSAVGVKSEQGAWNHVVSNLQFKCGAKACIEGSSIMPKGYPFTVNYRVVGSKSGCEYRLGEGLNKKELDSGTNEFLYYDNLVEPIKYEDINENPYKKEIQYFLDCVENNIDPSIVTLDSTIYVMEIIHKIKQSLEENKPINL